MKDTQDPNSILNKLNEQKEFNLEKFMKETPRKLNLHILSSDCKDCVSFVEYLTQVKIQNNQNELLLEQIPEKLTLFSLMNYFVYANYCKLMDSIIKKGKEAQNNNDKNNFTFSEVVIILDNSEINNQIENIRKYFLEENIFQNEHFVPFFIFITPKNLDLSDFLETNIFQYEIILDDILKNNEKNEEITALYRKINILFCYYNELGDEFSFVNSKGEKIEIKTDENDSPISLNILLIGRTGVGKSTLINIILEEKKSLVGGTRVSTTTKDIIVYRKWNAPIKFYDVRGIEDEKSVENYIEILTELNGKLNKNYDCINVIFYCMDYSSETLIYENEKRIFEKLIDFDIPIFFIINKTLPTPKKKNKKINFENKKKETEKVIHNYIKNAFKNNEELSEKFINDYIKIFFINLIDDPIRENNPAFGINEVLSSFKELVPNENWEKLEKSCYNKNLKEYEEYCKKNIFLKNYFDFEIIKKKNKEIAENYLFKLETGAFFTGILPGADIGMEYYYRNLFKDKLKSIYGFDYEEAERESISLNNSLIINDDENSSLSEKKGEKKIEKKEEEIDNEIDKKVGNVKRNL